MYSVPVLYLSKEHISFVQGLTTIEEVSNLYLATILGSLSVDTTGILDRDWHINDIKNFQR